MIDVIGVILLGLIFLWLFIGGTMLGRIVFQTHDCVNTNFQKQAVQLEQANNHIKQLLNEIAHIRGVKAAEELAAAGEVQKVEITKLPEGVGGEKS